MRPQDYIAGAKDGCESGPPESVFGNAPGELQLQLEPGQSYQFVLRGGEGCDIQWDITQVGSGSRRLAAGETQTIALTVPPTAQPRSLIRGQVVIRRADGTVLSSIPVAGWVRRPQTAKKLNGEKWPFQAKLLLALIAVCAVTAVVWHCFQHPTLVVKPARMDLGTLWYSPPVGGSIETALVFTAEWRMPLRSGENPVLVAHKNLHFIGETGQGNAPEETFIFPLNNEVNEVRIPLECYNLSNETVQVSGTVSLTVSNARARVFPSNIHFGAEFKPVNKP
jgi:hypothetical protein